MPCDVSPIGLLDDVPEVEKYRKINEESQTNL
jgi:hypothetical protein